MLENTSLSVLSVMMSPMPNSMKAKDYLSG
jgi:hypothetical protein